jgi:hypothetical protein
MGRRNHTGHKNKKTKSQNRTRNGSWFRIAYPSIITALTANVLFQEFALAVVETEPVAVVETEPVAVVEKVETVVETEPVVEKVDLESMTKTQLIAHADKVGAKVFKSWNKAKIKEAIILKV